MKAFFHLKTLFTCWPHPLTLLQPPLLPAPLHFGCMVWSPSHLKSPLCSLKLLSCLHACPLPSSPPGITQLEGLRRLTWLHRLAGLQASERHAVPAGAGHTCSTHTPGSPHTHTSRQGHLFQPREAAVVCHGCWQRVWPHSLQAGALDPSSATVRSFINTTARHVHHLPCCRQMKQSWYLTNKAVTNAFLCFRVFGVFG